MNKSDDEGRVFRPNVDEYDRCPYKLPCGACRCEITGECPDDEDEEEEMPYTVVTIPANEYYYPLTDTTSSSQTTYHVFFNEEIDDE